MQRHQGVDEPVIRGDAGDGLDADGAERLAEAIVELARGLVGEGEAEEGVGGVPLLDQVHQPRRHHRRLPRPGAGHDGAVVRAGLDGPRLFGSGVVVVEGGPDPHVVRHQRGDGAGHASSSAPCGRVGHRWW